MTVKVLAAGVLVVALSASVWAQVMLPQQARDTQQDQAPATALIMGTVVSGSAGQPADGVRVTLSGSGLRGSRSSLTDDDGNFAFVALPPGTYTLRATKTGHISATYGQKSPGRPGTPIVLAVGQQLKSLSLDLPKGGVISGTVFDEKNRPSISTSVRVMHWTMQSGERVLNQAGTATTDDRGIYRVFGLAPGDYLVSAMARNNSSTVITVQDEQGLMRMEELMQANLASAREVAELARELATPNLPSEPVSGYAPVYYPGTANAALAQTVKLGASQEQLGIDFQLQRVPLSKVTGQVIVPPGITITSVQVRLREDASSTPGQQQFSTRPDKAGRFTFNSVPPGQYVASAIVTMPVQRPPVAALDPQAARQMEVQLGNSSAGAPRLWAMADVLVDGGYSPDITLALQEGMTVSGSVSFNGTAPLPARLTQVRVTLAPLGRAMSSSGVSTINVNADAAGRFTFKGVVPGQYRIRTSGTSGWSLKSAMAGGRDTLDFWLEVEPGQDLSNVSVVFGDKNTDLKGVLQNQLGQPTADYTVIIFPSDSRYWVPQARRMRSVRPSTDGNFSFMGLPEGEYRLAAVTDIEPGAWYDPELLRQLQIASVPVRLAEGQAVIQDLRVSAQ